MVPSIVTSCSSVKKSSDRCDLVFAHPYTDDFYQNTVFVAFYCLSYILYSVLPVRSLNIVWLDSYHYDHILSNTSNENCNSLALDVHGHFGLCGYTWPQNFVSCYFLGCDFDTSRGSRQLVEQAIARSRILNSRGGSKVFKAWQDDDEGRGPTSRLFSDLGIGSSWTAYHVLPSLYVYS